MLLKQKRMDMEMYLMSEEEKGEQREGWKGKCSDGLLHASCGALCQHSPRLMQVQFTSHLESLTQTHTFKIQMNRVVL